MPMQIDTRKADPTDDRSAFIGSVLACVVVLAGLITADILFASPTAPHHLTQGDAKQAPRGNPS
jgi:hypothetical protein